MKAFKDTIRAFKYTASLWFGPLAVFTMWLGGGWTFALPVVVFGLIPLVELLFPGVTANMTEEEEREALSHPLFDVMVYAVLPLQYGVLLIFLFYVSSGGWTWLSLSGATWSMGILCGAYGINVGHELGHRKKKHEQAMAKGLLLSSLYMHFFIEHNRGHHARVATEDDPATSRYGELLYTFWFRSMVMGYISAWQIEGKRLQRKGLSWMSWDNEMLRFQVIQLGFVLTVFAVFGWQAMLAFVVAALLGALLLETVNYIEHYGLQRRRKENGRYENVLPIHSWNSNHTLGRLLLFELTRHSDHHAHANRHYQVLRHHDESPQLPSGYPGMMVLAMCPPLWFFVMHRQIRSYQRRYEGMAGGELVSSPH